MKKLIILGSGFTRAFCSDSPTISNIFGSIKDVDLLNKIEDLKNIGITDPETIISQLLDSLYEFDQKSIIESNIVKYKLINAISQCFTDLKADDEVAFSKVCEKYLTSGLNQEVFIASFNYDLLIEKYAQSVNYIIPIKFNPFIYKEYSGAQFGSYTKKYRLLKLHGSINWFINKYEKIDINNTFYIDYKPESINKFLVDSNPVIVPFTYNKAYFMNGDLFTIIWRQMNILLQDVDEIVIIGYGFPKTDYQIYKLLLTYQDKITKIIVKEDSDNRIHKAFGSKVIIDDAKNILI
jgi:hypothetical protein